MNLPVKVSLFSAIALFCLFVIPNTVFSLTPPSTPCYRIQTASFLTLDKANEHMLNLGKILANILPFDSTETLRIEKYAPYYTVRVGCLQDQEQMESLLTMLRIYWPDVRIIDSQNTPEQSLMVASQIVKGPVAEEEPIALLLGDTNDVSVDDCASKDLAVEMAPIQVKKVVRVAIENPEKDSVLVQAISAPRQSPEKNIATSDYILLLFLAMLFFISFSLTLSMRRQL